MKFPGIIVLKFSGCLMSVMYHVEYVLFLIYILSMVCGDWLAIKSQDFWGCIIKRVNQGVLFRLLRVHEYSTQYFVLCTWIFYNLYFSYWLMRSAKYYGVYRNPLSFSTSVHAVCIFIPVRWTSSHLSLDILRNIQMRSSIAFPILEMPMGFVDAHRKPWKKLLSLVQAFSYLVLVFR